MDECFGNPEGSHIVRSIYSDPGDYIEYNGCGDHEERTVSVTLSHDHVKTFLEYDLVNGYMRYKKDFNNQDSLTGVEVFQQDGTQEYRLNEVKTKLTKTDVQNFQTFSEILAQLKLQQVGDQDLE